MYHTGTCSGSRIESVEFTSCWLGRAGMITLLQSKRYVLQSAGHEMEEVSSGERPYYALD